MTALEKSLYDALLEAGVKDKTASLAAEKASEYASKDDLAVLTAGQNTILQAISSLEAKVNTVQWLVGGVGFALIASVFIKLFE